MDHNINSKDKSHTIEGEISSFYGKKKEETKIQKCSTENSIN